VQTRGHGLTHLRGNGGTPESPFGRTGFAKPEADNAPKCLG
jgi:hypothetical protein